MFPAAPTASRAWAVEVPILEVSLSEVADRLGATSINAYARYEQGRSIPTVQKLSQLFAAVSTHRDFVVVESEA